MKEFDWLQPTLERISDLLKMPDVHNSYGTPKVNPGAVWIALRMIGESSQRWLPVPAIFPTAEPGACFVWHGLNTECSLTVFFGKGDFYSINVSAKKGALEYDFGEFSTTSVRLAEALGAISAELFPVVTAP